jgi:hypothetical protein
MVLLSQRDLPTCGASPGSTRAVGPHRARLVTTPRQFEPALSLGTLDDATFAADAAPAASADDVVRRSLACECRFDLVSQRFDPRDRQPGRLVFGPRRIAATDTSNPNHELHSRQHHLPILHNPSVRLWMDSDSPSTDW